MVSVWSTRLPTGVCRLYVVSPFVSRDERYSCYRCDLDLNWARLGECCVRFALQVSHLMCQASPRHTCASVSLAAFLYNYVMHIYRLYQNKAQYRIHVACHVAFKSAVASLSCATQCDLVA